MEWCDRHLNRGQLVAATHQDGVDNFCDNCYRGVPIDGPPPRAREPKPGILRLEGPQIPSPAGESLKVRTHENQNSKGEKMPNQLNLDLDELRRLNAEGKSDAEIAEMLACSGVTVGKYRRQLGLAPGTKNRNGASAPRKLQRKAPSFAASDSEVAANLERFVHGAPAVPATLPPSGSGSKWPCESARCHV
jgi:hypothetical protein